MNDQEVVEPEQEPVQEVYEETTEVTEDTQEITEDSSEEEVKVPLKVLQKERRKRQEAEQEARFLKEQQNKRSAEEEEASKYESVTKEELHKTKSALKREIAEETWAADNPDKIERINDELPEFLKMRPNLAKAIDAAPNRYAEAWTLMNALSPKQKAPQTKPKPQAPGSPSGIPKAAAMNDAVDLMNMSDKEFNSWRAERRKRG